MVSTSTTLHNRLHDALFLLEGSPTFGPYLFRVDRSLLDERSHVEKDAEKQEEGLHAPLIQHIKIIDHDFKFLMIKKII